MMIMTGGGIGGTAGPATAGGGTVTMTTTVADIVIATIMIGVTAETETV